MTGEACTYRGKEYSHGAEICQEGTVKRCIDGDWVDLGRPCDGLTDSDEFTDIQPVDAEETEMAEGEGNPQPTDVKELVAYAEFWSIKEGGKYMTWRGHWTPGNVCAGNTQSYKVPREDVIFVGKRKKCKSNPTRWYREIRYIWPQR